MNPLNLHMGCGERLNSDRNDRWIAGRARPSARPIGRLLKPAAAKRGVAR